MTNFFQRLFSGDTKSSKFPKISWGHRLEGIEYEIENNSLYIDSTFIGGRKIYTDSIKSWTDNQVITQIDKANIFNQIIQFANKKSSDKPIVIINVDYDKDFWEQLCNENSESIKEVQYDSDKQKEEFQFNYLLDSVRKNGTLIFGDKTIKTESEFLDYWNNRSKS
jgi:hypothetical protein